MLLPQENCSQFEAAESSRCLDNRVKKTVVPQLVQIMSILCLKTILADIFHFRVIDKESKQVA